MKALLRLRMRLAAGRIEALQRDLERIDRDHKLAVDHVTDQLCAEVDRARRLRAELYAIERPALVQ